MIKCLFFEVKAKKTTTTTTVGLQVRESFGWCICRSSFPIYIFWHPTNSHVMCCHCYPLSFSYGVGRRVELESELISRVGSDCKTGMIVIGNADAEMNENNYDVVCMCRHMSIYSYIYIYIYMNVPQRAALALLQLLLWCL
ncbi:hypothetical protein, unlikely [Trypanosoma brucei gambiense DAL972]|uniref:Uncharacterized protein n=1 Tax=Trypanosoma brucei gambiense (strain MHOM/CI/86/DAL972) TaxID=679716 RepID=D0A6L4_TRYB9|nr:hypothetical protein, unlikely [Trypanosoma brucei gambiense DAL972]CBH17315.1 hypothetical protein, unlikely [Trypanosoma brucei gambiense DAL972]|eukprot:XP_011779579.1 hypothetical protein, unlikely [Trypanosoma brucei gambiense DAL972]